MFDICNKLKLRDFSDKVKEIVNELEKGLKLRLGNVEQNTTLEIEIG